jgi:protein-S-isoprenylcysteine O-methyltransferase Ste14
MVASLGVLWLLLPPRVGEHDPLSPYLLLAPCTAIVLLIAVCEWIQPRWRIASATALTHRALRPLNWKHVGVRGCGMLATVALVALAYALFPEYRGNFYDPYWQFLRALAPLAWLAPLYLLWADPRLADSHDEYHEFGLLILGQWRKCRRPVVARHLLGWLVKAFFLPLMVVYAGNEIRATGLALQDFSPRIGMKLYSLCYHLSYTIDLLFCVVGYASATRLFDNHIRSVDSTVGGWLVALMCYQPFYSVIGRYYLQYEDDIYWDNWLQAWPTLSAIWGSLIVVLLLIYSLSTVAFGLRFSNLTNRGIICDGPYRYSKHPAYLAKNLSWWLISVPFISDQNWGMALRNCAVLGLLNLVYFARARTEERHLSADSRYVAYALWINEHGLLRRFAHALPWLRYRAPFDGPR